MRILLLSHEMTYTGAPNSLLNVARILRCHGHFIKVYTQRKGDFSRRFNRYGFKVRHLEPNLMNADKRKALAKRFDIAICNTVFCGDSALKLQDFLPTILYIREAENLPDILDRNHINEDCIRNAENIVCVSEYAARFIEKTYSPNNIRVLHNFLISPFFGTVRQNKVRNKVRFLIAATIETRKGISIATEAFRLLPFNLQKQAVLDIYGSSPHWSEEYWQPLFAEKNDGIEYHGELKHGKTKMYRKSNVVLVPSLDESCSLTALEGAMYAKPLIVTENVGAKYLIDGSGFVVKTGSPESLSRAMQFFIEHKSELETAGYNSYLSFKNHSDKNAYYKGLNKILQEVLWEKIK